MMLQVVLRLGEMPALGKRAAAWSLTVDSHPRKLPLLRKNLNNVPCPESVLLSRAWAELSAIWLRQGE